MTIQCLHTNIISTLLCQCDLFIQHVCLKIQLSQVVIFYLLWYNVIPWSSHIRKRFSQKNNSGGVPWNVETNTKTLHARSNIFKKKNSKYEILNHLYFGPVFIFVGTALLTMVADTFTQPNHHKKASYGPVIKKKQNQFLLRGCKIVPW